MKYTKQYPGYNPKDFFYGFIGKDFPLKTHFFSEDHDIVENSKPLAKEIGVSPDSLCFIEQIHSDKCFTIKTPEFLLKRHEGDALATNLRKITLTVHTADCVPILFFDETNKNIAIAHSGWKGAIKGILQNTIKAMLDLGSSINNITAMIGPCIQQESYEVGPEFYENFISKDIKYKQFFINSKNENHFMFDLPGFNIMVLKESQITKILNLEENTYNSKQWFSYREDTIKNNKIRRGHLLSFIGIK